MYDGVIYPQLDGSNMQIFISLKTKKYECFNKHNSE
jgi:hypothetical protein